MKDETQVWLSYADENLSMSRLGLEHGHLNACLQNAQQAVEKYLKAVIVERNLEFRRTHSIHELTGICSSAGISIKMTKEEGQLIDSIYVPSKYPAYSALPDTYPDPEICEKGLEIAHKIRESVFRVLE